MLISLLQLYLISAGFNALPELAPPTSLLLSYFYISTGENIFLLTAITILGALTGRMILYSYVRFLGTKYIADNVHESYAILRKIIHKNNFLTVLAMTLYCISPVSTAAVFILAGAAKIRLWPLVLGFVFGRSIQYLVIASSLNAVYDSFSDLLGKNLLNPYSITLSIVGMIGAILLLYVDWKSLLIDHKLALHKKLLKSKKDKK